MQGSRGPLSHEALGHPASPFQRCTCSMFSWEMCAEKIFWESSPRPLSQTSLCHVTNNLPSNLSCHHQLFKGLSCHQKRAMAIEGWQNRGNVKGSYDAQLSSFNPKMCTIWCKVNVFSWDYKCRLMNPLCLAFLQRDNGVDWLSAAHRKG